MLRHTHKDSGLSPGSRVPMLCARAMVIMMMSLLPTMKHFKYIPKYSVSITQFSNFHLMDNLFHLCSSLLDLPILHLPMFWRKSQISYHFICSNIYSTKNEGLLKRKLKLSYHTWNISPLCHQISSVQISPIVWKLFLTWFIFLLCVCSIQNSSKVHALQQVSQVYYNL